MAQFSMPPGTAVKVKNGAYAGCNGKVFYRGESDIEWFNAPQRKYYWVVVDLGGCTFEVYLSPDEFEPLSDEAAVSKPDERDASGSRTSGYCQSTNSCVDCSPAPADSPESMPNEAAVSASPPPTMLDQAKVLVSQPLSLLRDYQRSKPDDFVASDSSNDYRQSTDTNVNRSPARTDSPQPMLREPADSAISLPPLTLPGQVEILVSQPSSSAWGQQQSKPDDLEASESSNAYCQSTSAYVNCCPAPTDSPEPMPREEMISAVSSPTPTLPSQAEALPRDRFKTSVTPYV